MRASACDSTPPAEERLMNQYRHLSAFPEKREVLQALKARGVVTGILSNGDPQMLGIAVRRAGLEDLLDHVLSVDSVRKYKTHPDACPAPRATGLAVRQIAFVSSNSWDALAATWYGYRRWGKSLAAAFRRTGRAAQPHGAASCATSIFLKFFSIAGEFHDRTHFRSRTAGGHRAASIHRKQEVLPAPEWTSMVFWKGFDAIVSDLAPKNIALLAERDRCNEELVHQADPSPSRHARVQLAGKDRLPRCSRPSA